MTYNEFLAKGGSVPKYLNYIPAFSLSSATTNQTTFKELVALTWGNVEMREDSVTLIQGDLNSVAFLVCSEYADKIANYIPLINAYLDDEEKEIHTGTDTNTRTPDLTNTTEGKAAPNGGASFASAYSTGGDIAKATGTEKNELAHGETITRTGSGHYDPAEIAEYQREVHSLYRAALAEFGILFKTGVA